MNFQKTSGTPSNPDGAMSAASEAQIAKRIFALHHQRSLEHYYYEAQAAVSRVIKIQIALVIVLTLASFATIVARAWTVAASLAGITISLCMGIRISFAICAADGVFAELHRRTTYEAFKNFTLTNPRLDDEDEALYARFEELARDSFFNIVFVTHRGRFKKVRQLLQFMRANRSGVIAGSGFVAFGQAYILLLKLELISHHLAAHWAGALSTYLAAWLMFWCLSHEMMKLVRQAQEELSRSNLP